MKLAGALDHLENLSKTPSDQPLALLHPINRHDGVLGLPLRHVRLPDYPDGGGGGAAKE